MVFPKELADELRKEEESLSHEKEKLYYDLMHDLFITADIKNIDEEDIRIFHLIKKIYHYGLISKTTKKEILKKIKDVHSLLKKYQKEYTYEDGERLLLLIKFIDDFLKHEANFLEYTPGGDKKEYVKMLDLINSPEEKLIIDKAELELIGGKLKYNNKEIQGVKITGNSIVIVGEHYSDKNTVKNIYFTRELSAEGEKYCYIIEAGKLADKSERMIRKIVGARHADANIIIKVEIPLHSCWIRVKRKDPAKFAIETRSIPISAPKPQSGFRVQVNNEIEQWAA